MLFSTHHPTKHFFEAEDRKQFIS